MQETNRQDILLSKKNRQDIHNHPKARRKELSLPLIS
jgi:hypothetical protein